MIKEQRHAAPELLEAKNLVNHSLSLAKIPTTKQYVAASEKEGVATVSKSLSRRLSCCKFNLLVQDMVEIVYCLSLFVAFLQRPFRVVAIIEVRSKPAEQICHCHITFAITVIRCRIKYDWNHLSIFLTKALVTSPKVPVDETWGGVVRQ